MEAFISKTEKKYQICLIIIIVVVIYVSVIVLPYNAVGKTLHSLEIESNSIVKNIPGFNVDKSPVSIAVDEAKNVAYVANRDSNTVSVIDGETLKVSNVNVGKSPTNIAVDYYDNVAYVANTESNTVSVIDEYYGTYKNIANVSVGKSPTNIAVDQLDNVAYVANTESNTVSVIDEYYGTYKNIANVSVGLGPVSIAVDEAKNVAYVANQYSDTVSVINGSYGTYKNIANVSVGVVGSYPVSIAFDHDENVAYVANQYSDTVSVINGSYGTYKNIANVSVGKTPVNIAVYDHIAYVANHYSNTVSVINGSNGTYKNIANVSVGEIPDSVAIDRVERIAYVAAFNNVSVINGSDGSYKNIANITTGEGSPRSIVSNSIDNIAYVANTESNTVSVIYGLNQKAQVAVSFDINPFHAGHIVCNNITVPTNQYFFIDFRTQCLAQPNKGFQFSSWIENLESNSSRTINATTPADSPVDWITSALTLGSKPTSSTLTVTKFGSFTANFEELPPPVPPEYWGTLFTVVATALIGTWLIPSVIGWTRSKRQRRSLRHYRKRIDSLNNSKPDSQVDHETAEKLKNNITTAYSRGEINELQHEILKEEILQYHQGAISKTIDSLKNMSDRNNDQYIQALDETRKQIKDAYSEGKINSEHYTDLKNEISVLYDEIYRKRIDLLNGRHDRDSDRLLNQIKNDIEDAYAKGKISEQHYNLLNKKIESFEITNNNKKTSGNKLGNAANRTDVSKRSPM